MSSCLVARVGTVPESSRIIFASTLEGLYVATVLLLMVRHLTMMIAQFVVGMVRVPRVLPFTDNAFGPLA